MKNKITDGTAVAGAIIAGSVTATGAITAASAVIGSAGGVLKGLFTGTTALDPGNIATVTRGSVTFTVTGVAVGDVVIMNPPADLNDDLIFVGAAVTDADEVTVYLYNPTGGGVNDTETTWTYLVLDLT